MAFPTCISVNNIICHYSPLLSEPDSVLAEGDLVKIDLGAHIDGFIAVVAHTWVLGASAEAPVTGRKADVIMAAHLARSVINLILFNNLLMMTMFVVIHDHTNGLIFTDLHHINK